MPPGIQLSDIAAKLRHLAALAQDYSYIVVRTCWRVLERSWVVLCQLAAALRDYAARVANACRRIAVRAWRVIRVASRAAFDGYIAVERAVAALSAELMLFSWALRGLAIVLGVEVVLVYAAVRWWWPLWIPAGGYGCVLLGVALFGRPESRPSGQRPYGEDVAQRTATAIRFALRGLLIASSVVFISLEVWSVGANALRSESASDSVASGSATAGATAFTPDSLAAVQQGTTVRNDPTQALTGMAAPERSSQSDPGNQTDAPAVVPSASSSTPVPVSIRNDCKDRTAQAAIRYLDSDGTRVSTGWFLVGPLTTGIVAYAAPNSYAYMFAESSDSSGAVRWAGDSAAGFNYPVRHDSAYVWHGDAHIPAGMRLVPFVPERASPGVPVEFGLGC